MDLSNQESSSLDEDLEVSSSDEEELLSLPMNEEDLLKLSDDDCREGRPKAQPSCSMDFNLETDAAGPSTAQDNMTQRSEGVTEVEDGEIEYPDVPDGVLSWNSKISIVTRSEIRNMDLDEICRQRNIHAPPRRYGQQNRARFQHDRQVAGARNKLCNIDPREYESLDDIIKRIPLVGLGRDHQTIRRRHHYGGGNGVNPAPQGLNEKLKKGVQSITECHPEPVNPILEPSEQTPEGYPEYRDEPWQCITKLVNKGLSIGWSLMKLKNYENLTEQEESRLYRCLVSYNQVEGVCEASKMVQAKHGAAVDLLGKLSKEFPNLGRFPEKVNEVLLIKQSVWGTLIRKMKEQGGGEYRFNEANDKVNKRTLFRCVLFMDFSKYEACSYLNGRAAKSMAIKMAYEDLLKEPCPMDTIHLGMEQCTSDQSLYRYVESHMIHCYDLSRSVVVDSKNVREQKKKTGGPHFPRRETCVPICYVKPQAGPKI